MRGGGGGGGGREAVCFDYFLLEGDDLRGGAGAGDEPDLRLADKSGETLR